MKFVVDRIEEDIVVLENIKNNEIKEEAIKILPVNIKEGSVLLYDNNLYVLDIEEEKIRKERIQNKLERLKGLRKDEQK